MSSKKTPGLGRGLDALLSDDFTLSPKSEIETRGSSSINEIPISDIIPNSDQPRTDFDPETLAELSASIKHIGLVQPITVRELPEEPGKYKIISGERRYRAAKMAGLASLPAYIRTAQDEEVMEMALIENIQRQDLNAIEISLAFQKLIETYSLTHEELSSRVGKKRTTVTNYLRLLHLPAEIQMALKDGKLSMGHARALLTISDPEVQLAFYEQIQEEALSVRQVEQMVRDFQNAENIDESHKTPSGAGRKGTKGPSTSEEYDLLARRFSTLFETPVKMSVGKTGKGKITIPFRDSEQLEKIIELLDRL
ncbi:MAG: ParB/RepB/Spo0J family partition protein [Porphyromonas sp.]|nr:ParB/RepB/Spo0J family partition protein [Bacteroidales bacterium]MDY3099934.1 ParB/RepB/Spo0J family partition protein [Porphyromonas sp.]